MSAMVKTPYTKPSSPLIRTLTQSPYNPLARSFDHDSCRVLTILATTHIDLEITPDLLLADLWTMFPSWQNMVMGADRGTWTKTTCIFQSATEAVMQETGDRQS